MSGQTQGAVSETLILKKGQSEALVTVKDGEKAPLENVSIGVGWDLKPGTEADLDLIVLCLGENDKLLPGGVFYWGIAAKQNLPSGSPFEAYGGALRHTGDNRTGAGDGDDEVVELKLSQLLAKHPEVKSLVACVHIYNETLPGVNFGQVQGAFIRAFDPTGTANMKFDLNEDYGGENTIAFAKVYIKDGAWKFRAMGEAIPGATDVKLLAQKYE
jgi:tellurium resistance protein TerD